MTRISQTFENLKSKNRTALITFLMAGDPDLETSLEALKALPEAGADIIELGMPFTDPAADGTVIQLAGGRALENGASMINTLDMVREFRKGNADTPIVLMGYTNPILAYGEDKFITDAAEAGVDGLIIVDLPPEEASDLEALCQNAKIDLIRLITPTTDEDRLKTLLNGAGGFLYYVSITGVTGAAKADLGAIKPHLDMIRLHTNLPIAIGFGIKTPDDAKNFATLADGVVVGSSLVQSLYDQGVSEVESKVKALSGAL